MTDVQTIAERAQDIHERLRAIVEAEPTAAVYMGVSLLLAEMEMRHGEPNRKDMLRLMDEAMTDFIRLKAH